jgi:hypothetical protein
MQIMHAICPTQYKKYHMSKIKCDSNIGSPTSGNKPIEGESPTSMQFKILVGNQCVEKCIKDDDASHHEQWHKAKHSLCHIHSRLVYLNNSHLHWAA